MQARPGNVRNSLCEGRRARETLILISRTTQAVPVQPAWRVDGPGQIAVAFTAAAPESTAVSVRRNKLELGKINANPSLPR
jgi:hypothetical protein